MFQKVVVFYYIKFLYSELSSNFFIQVNHNVFGLCIGGLLKLKTVFGKRIENQ